MLNPPRTHSGIRDLQNVQVARHPPHEGDPYLLHDMRVVRVPTIRQRHQEWFPGPGHQEEQEQDRLNPVLSVSCFAITLRYSRNRSLQSTRIFGIDTNKMMYIGAIPKPKLFRHKEGGINTCDKLGDA